MEIKQVSLTEEIKNILISFSTAWEAENSCYGYKANEICDLEGRTILIAYESNVPIGYLFGLFNKIEMDFATIPINSKTFEVEEMYVINNHRSKGVGQKLFYTLEAIIKDEVDYVTLSTATKNYKSILHFYIDELGMTFWYARLFKKIKK